MKIEMTRHQAIIPEVQGVNPDLLQDFWLQMRCTGPDLFAIQKFDGSTTQYIDTGWMPHKKGEDIPTQELRDCVSKLDALGAFVNKHLAEGLEETSAKKYTFHVANDEKCYSIYSKCSNGVIGVGWRFNDGDLAKARIMAVFTLYALGLQNADVDAVLWEMCYRHLPYVMDMDLSVADRVYLKHAAL